MNYSYYATQLLCATCFFTGFTLLGEACARRYRNANFDDVGKVLGLLRYAQLPAVSCLLAFLATAVYLMPSQLALILPPAALVALQGVASGNWTYVRQTLRYAVMPAMAVALAIANQAYFAVPLWHQLSLPAPAIALAALTLVQFVVILSYRREAVVIGGHA